MSFQSFSSPFLRSNLSHNGGITVVNNEEVLLLILSYMADSSEKKASD